MLNGKLKAELLEKEYRINQLEEILCPESSHDWVVIDKYLSSEYTTGDIEVFTKRKLQCCKCKKKMTDSDHPLTKRYQYKAREL